jgi:hypothetical protein
LRATLATAAIRLATIEPLAMQNLGMVLARRGASSRRRRRCSRSGRALRRAQIRLSGTSRLHLALAQLAQGDRQSAREAAERVLAAGFEPLHVGAWAVLSMVELQSGNVERSLADGRAEVELLTLLVSVEEFELSARVALAEALRKRRESS